MKIRIVDAITDCVEELLGRGEYDIVVILKPYNSVDVLFINLDDYWNVSWRLGWQVLIGGFTFGEEHYFALRRHTYFETILMATLNDIRAAFGDLMVESDVEGVS